MAVYQVGADGKAQKGLSVGDEVVTASGTYTVKGVNADGTYQSELTNKEQTTGNYTGTYANQQNTGGQVAGTAGASAGGYTPLNVTHANTKATEENYKAAVEQQNAYINQNPSAVTYLPTSERQTDTSSAGQNGWYTSDPEEMGKAMRAGYKAYQVKDENGNIAYYISDTTRTTAEGTSGADEAQLSDRDYAYVQYLKADYAKNQELRQQALAAGDTEAAAAYKAKMDQDHLEAERIRSGYGYSGGADGSMYIDYTMEAAKGTMPAYTQGAQNLLGVKGIDYTLPSWQQSEHGHTGDSSSGGSPSGSYGSLSGSGSTNGTGNLTWEDFLNGTGSGSTSTGTQMPTVDTDTLVNQWQSQMPDVDKAKSDQLALLEQWKNTLIEQNNGQIDYNVAKAITELERALEDAQPQYKEQQETIAKDERQAMDNSALYAEMRGDKGGIGQEQYNSIQNTAAQNRLSVQQAQTKLATDTQRQIADLRAQGEFDKADAALEVSQQYLAQLMSLEQWAFDAGMTVAQFKVSLDQWAKDYELAMAQFQTSVEQWNKTFAYQQYRDQVSDNQWQLQFEHNVSQDNINNEMNWAQIMGTTSSGQQTLDYQKYLYGQEQDSIANDMSWAQILGTTSSGQQTLNYQEYLYNQQKNLANQALDLALAGQPLSTLQYEAIKTIYGADKTTVDNYIAAAKLAAKNEQDLAWYKATQGNESGNDDDGEIKMTLANAKLMAEAGQFTDAVLQAFYDAGFTDTYLTETYGYEPSKQGSTDRTTYGTKYDKASVEAMNTAKAWIAKHMDANGNLPEGDEAYQIFLSAVEKVLDKYSDSELSKDGLSAILDMLKTMWGSPLATSNTNPINNTFKWEFSRPTN